jgi:NAD(P)-dependent dehydrogenase (short-subunit alcohol dehydrogenase family)
MITTTSSPYYTKSVWGAFSAIAALYSTVSHVALGCLHPFGLRLQTQMPIIVEHANKVAIVTGSNTGVGLETAHSLIKKGYTVIMACRSRDKALAAIEKITSPDSSGKAIFLHPLDLSSIESIQEFSKAVAEKYDAIDVLINNAGRNTSGQCGKLDLCFQTNFLGHFTLTKELMPLLKASTTKGRVVNLASVMHHYCGDSKVHDFDYWKSCALWGSETIESTYSPSKLAALLFTVALRTRFPDIDSIAVNPGSVNSDIWRGFPRFVVVIFRYVFLTIQQGSTCSVAAATLPSKDLPLYLQPYWMPPVLTNSKKRTPHPVFETLGPYAGYVPTSPRLPSDGGTFEADELWKASEDVTGCKFA